MELLRKNIHTQRLKSKAVLQMPLEADINVSDTKPDVSKIIYNQGRIKVDEIKTGMNKVWVKGKLCYRLLYKTAESANTLDGMEGEVPFSEEIYMDEGEGLLSSDRVVCHTSLDEMTIQPINSRKLNLRSVITIEPRVEEIVERQVCTGIELSPNEDMTNELEYRKKNIEYLETSVQKRDLLRLHEDTKLPSGTNEIGTLLWKSLSVGNINFKPANGRLVVNGELNLFVVYRESDSGKVSWYETAISFNSDVECQSCSEGMLADVAYEIGNEEITVKDNEDGEARIISNEITLELEIKLYEHQSTQVMADVYGVSCQVDANIETENFKDLYADIEIDEKLTGAIRLDESEPGFLQICHCDSKVSLTDVQFNDNTVRLRGSADIKLLYTAQIDNTIEIYSLLESIPFEVTKELLYDEAKIGEYSLYISISSQNVTIKDALQVEWRGNITAKLLAYSSRDEELLTSLDLSPINPDIIEKLPGFAIYYVKPGDSLWQIGKKYYVSVQRLKDMNNLPGDEIHAGDRILIVK
jgi:LysM repeat protein